jgi:hypothetical protein
MNSDQVRRWQAEWQADVAKNGIFAYGTVVEQYPLDGRLCPRCEAAVRWDEGRWQCPACGAMPPPDEQPGGRHA